MSEDLLPEGWSSAPLADLAESMLGKMLDRAKNEGEMHRYLRNINVRWGEFELEDLSEMRFTENELERYSIRDGDIVVCEGGEPGRCAVWRSPASIHFQKALHRVRVRSGILPEWIALQLKHSAYNGVLQKLFTGTTIKHLTGRSLKRLEVRVPPLNEQRRIVAKLESLQARSRRAREALEAVPPLLEKLRQSILAAAFRGDLTADWRAQNPDVEPASKLLDRIRTERRRRWEEAELAKLIAKGKPPKNDKWKDKYKEPEPVDPSGLPSLPEGWCWASIEQLTDLVTSGSRGWARHYAESGATFVRVGNLRRDRLALDLSEVAYVTPPAGAEGTRTSVRPGDVLISITADVGMVGVVREGLGEAYINQHLALLRLTPEVNSDAFAYSLLDPDGLQRIVRDVEYGATKASLSLVQVRGLPVPVPPVAEQVELVGALRRGLDRLDDALVNVQAAGLLVDSLDRAALAAAFSGQLCS